MNTRPISIFVQVTLLSFFILTPAALAFKADDSPSWTFEDAADLQAFVPWGDCTVELVEDTLDPANHCLRVSDRPVFYSGVGLPLLDLLQPGDRVRFSCRVRLDQSSEMPVRLFAGDNLDAEGQGGHFFVRPTMTVLEPGTWTALHWDLDYHPGNLGGTPKFLVDGPSPGHTIYLDDLRITQLTTPPIELATPRWSEDQLLLEAHGKGEIPRGQIWLQDHHGLYLPTSPSPEPGGWVVRFLLPRDMDYPPHIWLVGEGFGGASWDLRPALAERNTVLQDAETCGSEPSK